MTGEIIFEGSCKWPASTIDGEPGLQSGHVSFTRDPDGTVLISGCDGPDGTGPEDAQYWEYVLPPEQAEELLAALLRSRRTS